MNVNPIRTNGIRFKNPFFFLTIFILSSLACNNTVLSIFEPKFDLIEKVEQCIFLNEYYRERGEWEEKSEEEIISMCLGGYSSDEVEFLCRQVERLDGKCPEIPIESLTDDASPGSSTPTVENDAGTIGTATPMVLDEFHFGPIEAVGGWCFEKPESDLVPGQTCGYTLRIEMMYPAHESPAVISCTVTFDQLNPDDHVVSSNFLDRGGGSWTQSFELGGRYETMDKEYIETLLCTLVEWDSTAQQYGSILAAAEASYFVVFEELKP